MASSKNVFDFSKHKTRHIALKLLYFGWDYDGLAEQNTTDNTIEHHLINALTKVCLIRSRQEASYNRCGRTDKGVSSYGQVLSMCVVSNQIDPTLPLNVGLTQPADYSGPDVDSTSTSSTPIKPEINYVNRLNRVLPDHIRAVAWAPVTANFSARFSCKSRSYTYIFPTGDLDLEAMRLAATYLVGEHDFRNMCSFDLKNGVWNHVRTILAASIEPIASHSSDGVLVRDNHFTFQQMTIEASAFLYHQIRCIMTILFLVGSRKEPPTIVRDLLDLSLCPSRPHYNRASPMPLSLFDCKYGRDDMPFGWLYDQDALDCLIKHLKRLWTQYRTKSMMIEQVLLDLNSAVTKEPDAIQQTHGNRQTVGTSSAWKDFGLECDNMSDTKYVPILKRTRDEPLESRRSAMDNKKLKLSVPQEP